MQLSTLIPHVDIAQDADKDVAGIQLDSKAVKQDDVFIAIRGTRFDGRDFIDDAIKNGACAVLVDTDQEKGMAGLKNGVPIIPVHELKKNLGLLASFYYDHPTMQMPVFGVTGTNGKTTVSHYIADMITQLGHPCGLIGTLGAGFYGELTDTGYTTPDPICTQRVLAKMLENKAKAVAMEVSSISVDQHRVNGIAFDIAIFTNLSQDHLDYHGDMATYARCKKAFLVGKFTDQLVMNIDDEYGAKWAEELAVAKPIFAYSLKPYKGQLPGAFATSIKPVSGGLEVTIDSSWGQGTVVMPVVGEFNVSNVLAAVTTLCAYGVPFENVLATIPQLKSVPGRMQRIGGGNKPTVVVDFAHTPDALEKALSVLKPQVSGKLICVFGCGGDRDQQKRPLMAQVAQKWADKVIITSDNPRSENPADIAEQVLAGCSEQDAVEVELDRSKAIANSIQCATLTDCILIAGKGAEKYQEVDGIKHPFDDVEHAQTALRNWQGQ